MSLCRSPVNSCDSSESCDNFASKTLNNFPQVHQCALHQRSIEKKTHYASQIMSGNKFTDMTVNEKKNSFTIDNILGLEGNRDNFECDNDNQSQLNEPSEVQPSVKDDNSKCEILPSTSENKSV